MGWFKSRVEKEEKLAERSSKFLQELKRRKQEGTLKNVLNEWIWIFHYTKQYKGFVILYTVIGVLSSTFSIVSAVASKYTIDIITGRQTSKLWIVILVMVSSTVISLLLSSLINRVSTKLSLNINNDIQAEVYDHLVESDWMSLTYFSNGDILNRFNSDISTIADNAINWLPTIIISVYQFAATFFVIWFYSPVMALIAISSAPILLLGSRYILRVQRNYLQKVRKASSQLMNFEVESFYNMDTIKSFGISKLYSKRLRENQNSFLKLNLDFNKYQILTNALMSILSSLVEFVAFGYCLLQLWSGQISYGTMTLFLQQRSSLTSSFNKVVSIIPNILNASVSAERIRELLNLPLEEHIKSSSILDRYCEDGFTVTMQDLDFNYQGGQTVIKNSNFIASPGEIVSIVGPSGEGKTTMIRLMLGLINPLKGDVRLTHGEISVKMNSETRHLFSYVPQGNTILSGTIYDNMKMVKEDATENEMVEALKTAEAWGFISKFPDGIYHSVGERGRGLSEGQAQRISIARAVLRDAPILLLDEATSALDIATERKVLKNIIKSQPNKTIIITTHRPSVLNMCQRVYRVMDKKITILSGEESSRMAMDF